MSDMKEVIDLLVSQDFESAELLAAALLRRFPQIGAGAPETISDKAVRNWGERHYIQGSTPALRTCIEDARALHLTN